jgi:hypothetical protein
MKRYRLALQTAQRLFLIGAADVIQELQPILAQWFAQTIAGRSVYDDQVRAVLLYQYDPQSNSYIRRGVLPAGNRQDAINAIMGFVGV